MNKKQQGFTLIEIMVVVVIIGMLIAIVAPNVLGNKDKAMVQKAVADINGLESALEMYYLDNSTLPTTEQGLQALVQEPTPAPRNYRQGGYIKRLPTDPWGRDYIYINPGEHGRYDLYTLGADGQEGGDELNADIGNWNLKDFQK
ncbi:type II secretion system major pseudopilin GspG [Gallaecimonas pentaromativorans]|uniref:Type II secretion system core protein G n=1 Tax=Gallaecimonas pentaromativorans TaxID=584787 RepID=A0A3N1NVD8_9GAMM|nr:type II secretion system major pseudopilin GspG [Gallaecimonas pentaromativorans]MED5526042.1 type II secretion system major pseudopilin GspG [Pseudomonadota bacterium]ROQ18907.1 type II secretion system protein G (GspG) [Gallaecimonas pentaromativorans]